MGGKEGETLALFPSRRVLLPGARLGLQVFEERYRLMLDQLDDDRFAVVLLASGEEGGPWGIRSLGTRARLLERRRLSDGGDRLMVVGERRFEITEFLSDDPYPLVLVEYLSEGSGAGAAPLMGHVEHRLRRYLGLLAESGEGEAVMVSLSREEAAASYQVASLMRISNPERQELLELPTAGARLEREMALLRREIGLLESLLARGDAKKEEGRA